ncbi:MAG: response regulator [Deltaproteobacteria bacterium]|nr:response regulator [Deltaproteobacteria bacterium]
MESRLLLVDDNADFLDSTKDVLEEAGYLVMTASNGEEALSLSRKEAFDVILMDIKMPGLNGVETFLQMKKRDPEVKVVLFTAYSVAELIQRALQEGVCGVLNKPLDMSGLFRLIEDIGGKRGGGCVLIVDDDRTLCDSLRDALEVQGYKVATAFEGAEALRKAEMEHFDILLLDMKLPGKNGLEVYRELKRVHPSLVTILITGYAEEFSDLIREAIKENAYACIKKPVDMNRLLGLLEEVSADAGQETASRPPTR